MGDVRMNGAEEQIKPVVYVPYAQNSWPNAIALSHVVIRTLQDPASIISAMRRELRSLDPELVLYQPRPMDEAFSASSCPSTVHDGSVDEFCRVAVRFSRS